MLKLAEEIIKGRRLHSGEDLSFFITADLNDLCKGADLIREELCGDRVDLCSIINGRGGKCIEIGNNTSQDREMLADMGYQLKALPGGTY